MKITLQRSTIVEKSSIQITGSKSESNRLLLLQALFPNLKIENLSNSDDSVLMAKALQSKEDLIDIHHAGTAMRFLTAYFSLKEGSEITLTGSQRMQERPIKILVEALQEIGAEINYQKNEGYPPLKIKGKQLTVNAVELAANISSQYISALLLIAPKLKQGLQITLNGSITSVPYIKMTLSLLNQIGVQSSFENNVIKVFPKVDVPSKTLEQEKKDAGPQTRTTQTFTRRLHSEIRIGSPKVFFFSFFVLFSPITAAVNLRTLCKSLFSTFPFQFQYHGAQKYNHKPCSFELEKLRNSGDVMFSVSPLVSTTLNALFLKTFSEQ